MERNRLFILAALILGFMAVTFLQGFVYPSQPDLWHLLEIFTAVAAAVFYVPGAVAAAAASIGVGLIFVETNPDMLLNYIRLALIAGVIGWYAWSRQFQQEHLGRLLMVDRLTGVHNYSYFIDRLDEERKRADRFGSRLALIMVDIDHFKAYNDKYGRQLGDELLKHAVEIFKMQVRGVDIVSRYGGEEFAILLPNTGRTAAREVAERIRAAVDDGDFEAGGGAEKRTVSAGVAVYPDDAEDDLRLIDRADEALCEAKESGRNRVVVYAARSTTEAIS